MTYVHSQKVKEEEDDDENIIFLRWLNIFVKSTLE